MSTRLRIFLSALCIMLSAITIAYASDPVEHKVGDVVPANVESQFLGFVQHCGDPCDIGHNDGGMDNDFAQALTYAKAHKIHLRVTDVCASNCALFADQARELVCVTPSAKMAFHANRWYHWNGERRVDHVLAYSPSSHAAEPKLSPALLSWVKANGGFPWDGWTIMDAKVASAFWKTC